MSSHEPTSDPRHPDGAPDPVRLLRARLRDTTPEFEARFDEMRRRLAQEPPRRGLLEWLGTGAHGRWAGFGAGVAAMLVVAGVTYVAVRPHEDPLSRSELAAFGELVSLDDALRDALPLADPDTLDALLLIPASPEGGHS